MSTTNTDKNWKTETTVTDEQVAFYNENGYLKFGRIFTQPELDELRGQDRTDGFNTYPPVPDFS